MSVSDWIVSMGGLFFFGGMFLGLFASVDKDSTGRTIAGWGIMIGTALLLLRGAVFLLFHS